MIAAALIISIVALLASALCALAVMELIAIRPPETPEGEDALVEEFELSSKVAGTAVSSHGLPDRLESAGPTPGPGCVSHVRPLRRDHRFPGRGGTRRVDGGRHRFGSRTDACVVP